MEEEKKEIKYLYRYVISYSNYYEKTSVELKEYIVLKETDCTYLIHKNIRKNWNEHLAEEYFRDGVKGSPWLKYGIKRVKKNAYNTFAFDTKEKAKKHFIRRTEKRISWMKYWSDECKKGIRIIKNPKFKI